MLAANISPNRFQRVILWLVYQLLRLILPKVVIDGADFNVSKIEPTPHVGGEKHNLVYTKLLQQYPGVPRRLLSLAVELAVYRKT